MAEFSIIVAMDQNRGIGKDGKIPWHLPEDLKYFKEITTATKDPAKKNVVIMGRKTWESIPEKFRPLPQRINLVLTRNKTLTFPQGVYSAGNLKEALGVLEIGKLKGLFESVLVIGGGQVYQEAIAFEQCRRIYATHVEASYDCDAYFPEFASKFTREKSSVKRYPGNPSVVFTSYLRNIP